MPAVACRARPPAGTGVSHDATAKQARLAIQPSSLISPEPGSSGSTWITRATSATSSSASPSTPTATIRRVLRRDRASSSRPNENAIASTTRNASAVVGATSKVEPPSCSERTATYQPTTTVLLAITAPSITIRTAPKPRSTGRAIVNSAAITSGPTSISTRSTPSGPASRPLSVRWFAKPMNARATSPAMPATA